MAKVIKAPEFFHYRNCKKVFLAGSIEMGKAWYWQTKVEEGLADLENLLILNPRRDDWDSSWEQKFENKQFREQVEWELKAQEDADLILMYFDPETQSPITLLELGLFGRGNQKLIVCCPEGFWRKGNVDITCQRYGIEQTGSILELIKLAKAKLKESG